MNQMPWWDVHDVFWKSMGTIKAWMKTKSCLYAKVTNNYPTRFGNIVEDEEFWYHFNVQDKYNQYAEYYVKIDAVKANPETQGEKKKL